LENRMGAPEPLIQGAFEERLRRTPGYLLAAFIAEWCGFCRRFLPVFHGASTDPRAAFVTVDLSDFGSPLWDRFQIEVVPTLLLFKGGQIVGRADGILGQGLTQGSILKLLSEIPG